MGGKSHKVISQNFKNKNNETGNSFYDAYPPPSGSRAWAFILSVLTMTFAFKMADLNIIMRALSSYNEAISIAFSKVTLL